MKNLKGLQAFTHIMALGTLTAAAKKMHMSESAVSRQLALCEQELGLTLFSRDNRRLVPTAQGQNFYDEAERILHSLEQIPKIAQGIGKKPQRKIRLVSTHRAAALIAIPAIEEFLEAHKNIQVSFETHQIKFLERWIASNQFDIGISSLPANHDDLVCDSIYRSPLVAILPLHHHLAEKESVTLEDLAQESIILPAVGTAIREKLDRIFTEQNFSIKNCSVQVNQVLSACLFVSRGVGISICDSLMPKTFADKLRIVPISPEYYTEFGLLFPKNVQVNDDVLKLAKIIRKQTALL